MTTAEFIKKLCEKKGISIHKLEMDLGFSNGSLAKANTIHLDRAGWIAEYFGITLEELWTCTLSDKWDGFVDEVAAGQHEPAEIDRALEMLERYRKATPKVQSVVDLLLSSENSEALLESNQQDS